MSLTLIHGPPNSGRAGRVEALFRAALDKYFGGEPDPRTLEILRQR